MNSESGYWAPHVTVAALIRRDSRFLMVEERVSGRAETVFNQPAGHLEPGESLEQAIVREVLEETGHDFQPERLLGVYQWQQQGGEAFLRFCFVGAARQRRPAPALDPDILAPHWLSMDEIRDLKQGRLRSPLVLRCIEDALSGVSGADLRLLQVA